MLWRSQSPSRRPEGFIEPCLPTLGHAVPSGPQWVHEIKHDGFRFICRREGGRVRVFSRRGNGYTEHVNAIADALGELAHWVGGSGCYVRSLPADTHRIQVNTLCA